MATNPMKRRERNAAIIGALIAFAIMAVVVFLVFTKYSKTKDELTQLQSLQKTAVVAIDGIESGTTVTIEDFKEAVVMTDMVEGEYFSSLSELEGVFFKESDSDDGTVTVTDMSTTQNIPVGTIITPNMIVESDNVLTDDIRIQEYSSIALPSQLKNGDIIDIRLTLPTGQDYIVLSKKEVVQTDETTIWIKVNEAEIQLLNSAMVEAWTITGTKLYAIEYVDAGSQKSATVTYKAAAEVMDLILANPNIVEEAKNELKNELNEMGNSEFVDEFRNYIDNAITEHIEERPDAAEEGFTSEITTMQTHRADYVEALQGTGQVGNDEVPVE